MGTVLVISEGPADNAFLKEVIRGRHLQNTKVVEKSEGEEYGDSGFEKRIEGLKLRPGIGTERAIVLVRDNDDDPARAFLDTQSQIQRAGDYSVPASPFELSERGKYPPIGVVLLPAAGEVGSLDTLCLSAINPKYAAQLRCVDEYARCLGVTANSLGPVKFAKLRVQCLLSGLCGGDPYTPLKCAWEHSPRKGRPGDIFPITSAVFSPIADFLKSISGS